MADQDHEQQVVLLEQRRQARERGAHLIARRDVDLVADGALGLALGDDVAEQADVVGRHPHRAAQRRGQAVAPGAVRGGVIDAAGGAGDDDRVALRRSGGRGGESDGEREGSDREPHVLS